MLLFSQHSLEEVSLSRGGLGHLPARWQRHVVGDLVGGLAEVLGGGARGPQDGQGSPGPRTRPHLQGGHAEVCYPDVVLLIQEQVLWLQVSVDDAFGMQIGERLHHARRVEPRGGVLERTPAEEGGGAQGYTVVGVSGGGNVGGGGSMFLN